MKKFDMKYRELDIDTCSHCKHCRRVENSEHYYCSIMDGCDLVSPLGICDSFKSWWKSDKLKK